MDGAPQPFLSLASDGVDSLAAESYAPLAAGDMLVRRVSSTDRFPFGFRLPENGLLGGIDSRDRRGAIAFAGLVESTSLW